VFKAYFTTLHIEPGYEKPIKTVEQMLTSILEDDSFDQYKDFFNESLEVVLSAVLKEYVIRSHP
jgi:hypothetical protein